MRRLVLLLALMLSGCPGKSSQKSGPEFPPCSEIGQRCEFSPGKAGTCVLKDDCSPKSACFVCQSQH